MVDFARLNVLEITTVYLPVGCLILYPIYLLRDFELIKMTNERKALFERQVIYMALLVKNSYRAVKYTVDPVLMKNKIRYTVPIYIIGLFFVTESCEFDTDLITIAHYPLA